jgi:hypothetical protein
MQRFFAVLLFSFLVPSLFPEERAMIQCDPGFTGHIPAWVAPGRPYVVEQLNCGDIVSAVSVESGYVKIDIGKRFAYVDAKYVRWAQTKKQTPLESPRAEKPDAIAKGPEKGVTPYGTDRGHLNRYRVGLNFEISHIKYDEPGLAEINPGLFMEEKGLMFGVSGDYTVRPKNFMFKMEGRFTIGNVEYSSPQGSDKIKDYTFEPRILFGRDLKTSENYRITPFIGIGYRYLFDGLKSADTTATLTYDRKSNYLYSPVGLGSAFRLGSGWSLDLSGEYDLFWHGWQFSGNAQYLGVDLGNEFQATNNQKDGWGARGSVRITKDCGRLGFAVEPYFRYWDIDHSDIASLMGGIIEPANKSREWGTKIGIRF